MKAAPLTRDPTAPLIQMQGVVKTFSNTAGEFTALRGIDLDVRQGEFTAVIGKSGSGISTTPPVGRCWWMESTSTP
jgi:ABC-type oligopeptide transport system ATPase subunit